MIRPQGPYTWDEEADKAAASRNIEHRDGIPWYQAKPPRRRWHKHKHKWQTRSDLLERCACGATRFRDDDPDAWIPEAHPRYKR